MTLISAQNTSPPPGEDLSAEKEVMSRCVRCGACAVHCKFLSDLLSPGQLAGEYLEAPEALESLAFNCSLCGFCSQICPEDLDLPAMFLGWRQTSVRSGRADLSSYRGVLAYEKKGSSALFSLYHLPRGCDTIFFPGCTLAGTRADQTYQAFEFLSSVIKTAGMVLDCCAKPSHDLGREDHFKIIFGEMTAFLNGRGIKTVVTACPSCHRIFRDQSPFTAITLYEFMADHAESLPSCRAQDENRPGKEAGMESWLPAVIQDPCQARDDLPTQAAVRKLVRHAGITIARTPFTGKKGFCCGEGGAVNCINPGFARAWADKRSAAAGGATAVTYCAGCVNFLSSKQPSLHLIDLILDPETALAGNARVARAPLTYVNRIKLKRRISELSASGSRKSLFKTEKETTWAKPAIAAGLLMLAAGLGAMGFF